MVPMPRFASWAEFNDYLKEQCRKRQADVLRGHKISIGERMQSDLAAMQSLPATPFEAFDQAAPLQNWDLPDAFATLQGLLETRQGKTGNREYVQVRRLLENYEQNVLHAAIKDALQMGALSFPSHRYCVSTAGQWMPSNNLCCVALNAGSPGWVWIFIRSYSGRMSPRH